MKTILKSLARTSCLAPLMMMVPVMGCDGDQTPTPIPEDVEVAPTVAPDRDGDSYSAVSDCDDYDISTYPGATEWPDGRDNDCDSYIDEGTDLGDDDLDGYSENDGDCDDADPSIHPGDVEDIKDGLDNDCDGNLDEDAEVSRADEPLISIDAAAPDHTLLRDMETWTASGLTDLRWVGDLDGDGFDDMVASVVETDLQGRVFVFYGPISELPALGQMGDEADATIYGTVTENSNGIFTAGRGDLDGDGTSEFVVGDPLHRRVALFYGGKRLHGDYTTNDADAVFIPQTGGYWTTGFSLAFLQDVDGDGKDELAIGQPSYDNGRGRVLLFSGKRYEGFVDLESAHTRLVGRRSPDFAGLKVASAGDMDGDGLGDFVVVAPGTSVALTFEHGTITWNGYDPSGEGQLYLWYGRDGLVGDVYLDGADAMIVPWDERTSAAVQFAHGDLDGDGLSDLVVTNPADWYGNTRGLGFVVYGSETRLGGALPIEQAAGTLIRGNDQFDLVGTSVSVGDVTGDGIDDLALTSPVRWVRTTQLEGSDGCLIINGNEYCNAFGWMLTFTGGQVALYDGRPQRAEILEMGTSGAWMVGGDDSYVMVFYAYSFEGDEWSNSGTMNLVRPVDIGGDGDGDGFNDMVVGTELVQGEWEALENKVLFFSGPRFRK